MIVVQYNSRAAVLFFFFTTSVSNYRFLYSSQYALINLSTRSGNNHWGTNLILLFEEKYFFKRKKKAFGVNPS